MLTIVLKYVHSSYAAILLVFCIAYFQLVVSCKYWQIEKHCFEQRSHINCDEMESLGSMFMPETLLITKAFDQQLRALANKISISHAE